MIPVRREGESYTYAIKVEIVNNEVVTLHTNWDIKGDEPGKYNITVSSLSNDPFMVREYSRSTGSCEIELISGSPVISDLRISPTSTTPGLDHDVLYVSPEEDIVVECNVSSAVELTSVKLRFSYGLDSWFYVEMEYSTRGLWVGTVPGAPPNEKVRFYVEAVSLTGGMSRTSEYECTILDVQGLERDVNMIVFVTAAVMLTGSFGIFDYYRHRMKSKNL